MNIKTKEYVSSLPKAKSDSSWHIAAALDPVACQKSQVSCQLIELRFLDWERYTTVTGGRPKFLSEHLC